MLTPFQPFLCAFSLSCFRMRLSKRNHPNKVIANKGTDRIMNIAKASLENPILAFSASASDFTSVKSLCWKVVIPELRKVCRTTQR